MSDFKKAADVWIKSFPLMVSQIRSEENLSEDRWEVMGVSLDVDEFYMDELDEAQVSGQDFKYKQHPDGTGEGVLADVELVLSDGQEVFRFQMFPPPSIRFLGSGRNPLLPNSLDDLDLLAKAFEKRGIKVFRFDLSLSNIYAIKLADGSVHELTSMHREES